MVVLIETLNSSDAIAGYGLTPPAQASAFVPAPNPAPFATLAVAKVAGLLDQEVPL